MLNLINELDKHLQFAESNQRIIGRVQINVGLDLADLVGLNPEEVTEDSLRARLRGQMIEFLYGELIQDIRALRSDLDKILKKLGVED
jgi:hypothetical protein